MRGFSEPDGETSRYNRNFLLPQSPARSGPACPHADGVLDEHGRWGVASAGTRSPARRRAWVLHAVAAEVKCSHLCLLARARPANLAGPGWGEPTPLAPGGAFLMTSLTKTAGVYTNNSDSGTHPHRSSLTKTSGVYTNNSDSGTHPHRSSRLCSSFLFSHLQQSNLTTPLFCYPC